MLTNTCKPQRFGTALYYFNTKNQLHREGAPAVEWDNGDTSWYVNGFLHREDGPAIDGRSKGWYYHGRYLMVYSQEEFLQRIEEHKREIHSEKYS